MQRNLIILATTIAVLGAAFGYGYHKGRVNQIEQYQKERQALQEELLDLNQTLQVKNAENLRLNREKQELIDELENEAITAQGSDGPGVGTTGGLQRLERRWSQSPTTAK